MDATIWFLLALNLALILVAVRIGSRFRQPAIGAVLMCLGYLCLSLVHVPDAADTLSIAGRIEIVAGLLLFVVGACVALHAIVCDIRSRIS